VAALRVRLVQIALDPVGDDLRLRRLSCGKALPSRRASRRTSSEQAGRLSLPACSEEDRGCEIGRKARGFPQVGAAEPH